MTDDFKIAIRQAINTFRIDNKQDFRHSIKYILKHLAQREYDVFTDYLYEYLKSI